MFFMIAFTALAFISAYEFLYSLFKKDLKISMFYVSRLITFAFGLGKFLSFSSESFSTSQIFQLA